MPFTQVGQRMLEGRFEAFEELRSHHVSADWVVEIVTCTNGKEKSFVCPGNGFGCAHFVGTGV